MRTPRAITSEVFVSDNMCTAVYTLYSFTAAVQAFVKASGAQTLDAGSALLAPSSSAKSASRSSSPSISAVPLGKDWLINASFVFGDADLPVRPLVAIRVVFT